MNILLTAEKQKQAPLMPVGQAVRQLVKQCAEQVRRDVRATHPKYRSYGGDLGRLALSREPRHD